MLWPRGISERPVLPTRYLPRSWIGLEKKAFWGGYSGYDGWFANDLNNARLALLATYNAYVPAFERLLADQDGDMSKFHEAVEALSKLPKEERNAELERLAAELS